jgi:ADP-ribose pyrophosphatase YjhB (NUDIX family)
VLAKDMHGVVRYEAHSTRPTDFLYRISLKCLVRNHKGEVLVVKERGEDCWDLPGGGMDHGEDFKTAIAREMEEEVSLKGTFTFKIIAVDEPARLREHNFWQVRLIFEVKPHTMLFSAGADSEEIAFMDPRVFRDSMSTVERRIHSFATLTV